MNIYWSGSATLAPTMYTTAGETLSGDPLAANIAKLNAKIISFRSREKGWHYGDGGPSPEGVVSAALRCVEYLNIWGLTDVDAFPGDSGEILLSAILGEHAIDVITEVDGTISVIYDRNDVQQSYQAHLSEKDALVHIARLARGIWSLSVGYTVTGLTRERTVLPLWPLETLETTGVYQSQSVTAYIGFGTHPVARYVSTLEHGTWTGVAARFPTRPYIGDLTRQYYQRIA